MEIKYQNTIFPPIKYKSLLLNKNGYLEPYNCWQIIRIR